jgi:hypothetical protein
MIDIKSTFFFMNVLPPLPDEGEIDIDFSFLFTQQFKFFVYFCSDECIELQ